MYEIVRAYQFKGKPSLFPASNLDIEVHARPAFWIVKLIITLVPAEEKSNKRERHTFVSHCEGCQVE
jgi:hypothetical protein